MAEERKQRGLTSEQWAQVKSAFESDGESIASLAKRFGVKRDTIAARRDRETWVIGQGIGHMPNRTEQRTIRARATSNVVDLASRRIVEDLDRSGVIDAVAQQVKDGLANHPRLASKLVLATEKLLDQYLAGTYVKGERKGEWKPGVAPGFGKGDADTLKALVEAGDKALGLERDIYGKRPGMPSVGVSGDSTVAETVEFIIVDEKNGTEHA